MPVVRGEVASDEGAHDIGAVVQHVEHDIVRHRRQEDHRDPADDARHRERQGHLPEGGLLIRAEIGGGLQQGAVES